MAEVNERADSMQLYLSGAGSDGGAQSDPDAALGAYRSSTRISELDVAVSNPITNVTVNRAAGLNGEGTGTLTAKSSDTLAWTPPSGTEGPSVTIANGETKILEGGGSSPDKYIEVTRTSATALTGAATLTLSNALNKLFDDVDTTEQTAGDTEYRALFIKNASASDVQNVKAYIGTLGTDQTSDVGQLGASGSGTITTSGSFADWPSSGGVAIYDNGGSLREIAYYSSRTGTALTVPTAGRGLLGSSAGAGASDDTLKAAPLLRIAKEDPGSQPAGNIQTIADESTAPTGVSWVTPHSASAGIDLSTMSAGYIEGLWIEKTVIAGATATQEDVTPIELQYDAA